MVLKTVIDALLTVLLLSGLLLIAGGATQPEPDHGFTELSLLHRMEKGTLVADDYQTNFSVGEAGDSLRIGVVNHEEHQQTYTVVVQLD